MIEKDAIELLQKVSCCKGDGSVELVEILDRVPLAIARWFDIILDGKVHSYISYYNNHDIVIICKIYKLFNHG